MEKRNEVVEILDSKRPNLEGYIIFSDNWLDEGDKQLKDKNGVIFNVLDFVTIEDNILKHHELMPHFNGWRLCERNCFKLDKEVSIGDVLFVVR
jgi:hypothetical protein